MASFVASMIVGQAFRYLQLAPPSSFEDDSDKARDANQMFPVALRAVLEAADWSFASRVAVLAPLATLPNLVAEDPEYPYSFKLPGDCVTIRRVGKGRSAWRVDEDGLLRAREPGPLRIRYTKNLENNVDDKPAQFRLAIAARLATYLAPIYLEAATSVQALEQLAANLLATAIHADARSASEQRYDGRDADYVGGYWADEVTR